MGRLLSRLKLSPAAKPLGASPAVFFARKKARLTHEVPRAIFWDKLRAHFIYQARAKYP